MDNRKSVFFGVRLEKTLADALEHEAQQQQLSKSEVAREVLRRGLGWRDGQEVRDEPTA